MATMTRYTPSTTNVVLDGWIYELKSFYRDHSGPNAFGYDLRPALRISLWRPRRGHSWLGIIPHPDAVPNPERGYDLWTTTTAQAWAETQLDGAIRALIDQTGVPVASNLPADHPHRPYADAAFARWIARHERDEPNG